MKLQMIKAKYLIFKGDSANELSKNVNEFLDKIDIRQVIKMENIAGNSNIGRALLLILLVLNILERLK